MGISSPRRFPAGIQPGLRLAMFCLCLLNSGAAAAAELELPADLQTYSDDGRLPIGALYRAYTSLMDRGWLLDVITQSQPPNRENALPVIALRTAAEGPAVWILAGIHGEEPAGPNAIAESIDDIAALGARRAVVLMPLNNPQGYAHNWRYLNMPVYSASEAGQSVGDSSHLLPDPQHPGRAREAAPSSPEAEAITHYVLKMAASYPPAYSIDLHEDNLITEGYVYSQGRLGVDDPLAQAAVRVLQGRGIPIRTSGHTRFGETIQDGLIGPVTDGSIDELMSAGWIIFSGEKQPGPGAQTVLVFETPADNTNLRTRIAAHRALLQKLDWEMSRPVPN